MPTDPAAFRSTATLVCDLAIAGFVLLGLVAAGIGWWRGGPLGLAIGAAIGGVIAACGAFASLMLWAMTQDGA